MASHASRGVRPRRLVAVVLALAAALPAPSVAAAPIATVVDGRAAAEHLDPGYLGQRGGERGGPRIAPPRTLVRLVDVEARLAELDAMLAVRIAAEMAAAEAAAKAAVEKAAAEIAATAAAEKAAAEKAAAAAKDADAKPAYSGTNHVWMPTLGVSRGVSWFECSRSEPPGNVVYRWGCAGTNNVYLFGHAWGVMKPLHDAYVAGRLKAGMAVVYADAKGRVRTYRVTEIRIVTPDQVDWAIAAQSRSSMTLQTCVGKNSEKRLLVRLVSD